MQDVFMSAFMTTQSIRISIVISTTIGLFCIYSNAKKNIKCILYCKLTEKIKNPNIRCIQAVNAR